MQLKPSVRVDIKTFLLALTIVFLSGFASVANACWCGDRSPCESYADASVVFVGVVIKTGINQATGQLPANAMSTTFTNGSPTARFKIEEFFRGTEAAELEISGQGTTCDYHFKQGERYVVYAFPSPDGATFHTNICSGTAPLSEAAADLIYLRSAEKRASGGTVFGEITREPSSVVDSKSSYDPIPKAEVIFENGAQRFQTVSEVKGNFKLAGLPPGRYKVHTNPPTNYSRADVRTNGPRNEWELDVPDHGCIQIWFVARQSGEISGTVGDASGIVAEDVEPELIPVDQRADNSNRQSVRLGESSIFKFSFLPPGRYYLGFNLSAGPTLMEPYPEFYYPGVEDRAKATIITLTEGQKISNIYLPRPLRLAERMIEGVAMWPNGRPYVENCGIQLTNPRTGSREGNCVSTDNQGYFKIKAVEGQTYELSASTTNGKSIALVHSKPLVIKVEKENRPVKLIVELP
jgi:hypothetical protein